MILSDVSAGAAFPKLLRKPRGRCASNSPPAGMMQSSVLCGEQISDSNYEPSVRDDDGCILQLSADGSEEAEKKDYNCQISTQTNKQTPSQKSQIMSQCEFREQPGCMCPLPFLQCKYESHTNGQTKGLTPYLHTCRDSYITNTPP